MEYIEVIVLINVLIHLVFIRLTSYVMGIKLNTYKIILSAILDIIYVVLYLLRPYHLEKFKYFFIFLISYIPFSFINKNSLTCFFIYLVFNMSIGGINEVLYTILNYRIIAILISIIIMVIISLIYAYKKIYFNHKYLNYELKITINKKCYSIIAYLDTGNFLKYNFIPIILVKNKKLLIKKIGNIPISGAINEGMIDVYKADCLEIKIGGVYRKIDAYLSYANIGYDALIGLETIGG